MFHISSQTPPAFLWLGKETTRSENWIHYSRRLEDYELMIVDKGTLYIANEHGKYTVNEGEYIIMSPCEHQYGWQASSCSFYWLHFLINETEQPETEQGMVKRIPKQARISDFPKVQTLLSQIYHNEQFYSDTTQSSFLLSALLLEFYNQLYQSESALKNAVSETGMSLQKTELCHKIKNYIYWNRSHRIKVSEIADYMQYSSRYLSTVFAEITGMKLKSYIDSQQIEAAKELLANSPADISEISYQLGYEDSHNFSRTFKRITGMSPKEYRASAGVYNTRP